jgi:hypothetical protein
MKGMGLLAALAVCVTVGGVYATWNYADTTTFTDRETISIGLTAAGNVTGESLEITSNTLSFLIDDTNGDKKGDTVVATGSIIATYSALENNYETVTIYCNIEIDGNLFASTYTTNLNQLKKTVTLDGTGEDIVFEVKAEDLLVTLGSQIVNLPTKKDYDNFTISGNQIRIEFTTSPKTV